MSPPETEARPRIAVVLIARGATAAAGRAEMERLAAGIAAAPDIAAATYAFTEQGLPTLRDAVADLRRGPFTEIRLVPLILPMEPSFKAWMARTLARWQAAWGEGGPRVRVGPGPGEGAGLADLMADLLADLVRLAGEAEAFAPPAPPAAAGSVVAAARRRVLVCRGAPCNAAGAAVIWGHLRAAQERLGLRTAGGGTMSATTSCLGPCGLAPVVQVWPEGTVYGGIDEAGLDRIVAEHLLGDAPVADLAYAATGRKQVLRPRGGPAP